MEKEKFCKERFGIKPSYPDEFYPERQLKKGIIIETEHVDDTLDADESPINHYINTISLSKCIAKNHLDEQRENGEVMDYYDRLQEMEKHFTLIDDGQSKE